MRLRYWVVPREVMVGDLISSHSLILVVDKLGDGVVIEHNIEPFDNVIWFKDEVEIGESVA